MVDLASLGLPEGSIVLVDTGPLIYYVEGKAGNGRRAVVESFLESARAGTLRLLASAIAWTELLAGPLASSEREVAAACRRLLADSSLIALEPIEVSIAEEAARLQADSRRAGRGSGLGLADALHIATARLRGAAAVLTNDEAWRRVEACPPVLLVDELAFSPRA